MKMKLLRSVLVGVLICITATFVEAIDIQVPVKSEYDQRHEYPMALLTFILEKTGVEYTITFNDLGVTTQARDRQRLKDNNGINLGWYGTSAELEQELVPIRFPIWRGLLGYRIFIINKHDQAKFDQVNTLEDLQQYRGDQGIGWSDVQILKHSGLPQEETKYDQIFAKINVGGRTDYFSRGVTEAFREVEARRDEFPNLAVERHVLLVYQFAVFFFTNRENKELAQILEDGFQKAYEDGSFEEFFYNHPTVKSIFEQANIEGRVRIDIPNPLLTPETLAIPDQYWHKR